MKFIVDAQLPKKLARWLVEHGFEAVHTLDLPDRNRTTDDFIAALSVREKWIVISKDSDFYDSYFQKMEPWKLLHLTVGNMPTKDLIQLFEKNLQVIMSEINQNNLVEVTKTTIITVV